MRYYGTNRYVCDVLEEMRNCDKTKNYAILPSLIEEVQTMVNRMEAGLGDKKDLVSLTEERSKLKQEVNKLEQKVKKLKEQLPKKDRKSS